MVVVVVVEVVEGVEVGVDVKVGSLTGVTVIVEEIVGLIEGVVVAIGDVYVDEVEGEVLDVPVVALDVGVMIFCVLRARLRNSGWQPRHWKDTFDNNLFLVLGVITGFHCEPHSSSALDPLIFNSLP